MSATLESAQTGAQTAEPPAEWMSGLNRQQREAATYGSRTAEGKFESPPLLIIAGAGTGKTNTLAHRVAHLRLSGVSADRILLLTFTRRAAEEMVRRAEKIVQQAWLKIPAADRRQDLRAKLTWAGTFHSIANRLLRLHSHRVGLDPSFSVLDRGDSADLIDVVRQELGMASKEKRFPRKDTCLAVYSYKINTQQPLKHVLEESFPWCAEWEADLTTLFRRYVEVKQKQQVLDYDDLLLYWHFAVQDAAFAKQLADQFDHVLVDEYQDTNTLQAEILLAIRSNGNGLCVVGDDAQSIYSFRAASVENILNFPALFAPPAQVAKLEKNYRSVQPILDVANTLIGESSRQYQKRLYSERPSQQKPRYVTVADDQAQADYVVERILATREAGVPLRQQAVLMRNSHHSDVLEVELVRRNIPYVKYGGLKFLEAAHVKDMLAILKWADNPKNRIAGFRVLQLLPGIGPSHAKRCLDVFDASGYDWSTLKAYQQPAAAKDDWAATTELLTTLSSATQWMGQVAAVKKWYEAHLIRLYDSAAVRMGDIEQLEQIANTFATRERFITELTLDPPQVTGALSGPPLLDEDYLILSTIHSAKGQEWDSVYLLHVADGTFPSEFSCAEKEKLEEERRLMYVAMTRAKQSLHLVAPLKYYITQQAKMGDRHVYGARSRFVTDAVMRTMDASSWPAAHQSGKASRQESGARIDVARQVRDLWG
ncbi:MAG TPA: ATP-dependent helicase [Steroidobacteraceae bacterium]|nr:ATP-dependent helicase [Steroidobacteraceae bacterium]